MYILASFVEDKVSICAWIYLWVFYFVPLNCISVFVPVPYCLDDCGFVVEPEVRRVDSSSSILLSQDSFGYSWFFFIFFFKLKRIFIFWNYAWESDRPRFYFFIVFTFLLPSAIFLSSGNNQIILYIYELIFLFSFAVRFHTLKGLYNICFSLSGIFYSA